MLTVMLGMCDCVILGMEEFCLSHIYYSYFVGPSIYAMIPFPSYYRIYANLVRTLFEVSGVQKTGCALE